MQITIERKPEWLKIKPPTTSSYTEVKEVIQNYNLHTVCQEAHCPNMSECWSGGTATFMLMGDTCTRGCRFCAVKSGKPISLDEEESKKLAFALQELSIFDYIVLTSVNRDDLSDGGASHLAKCITEIKNQNPSLKVEILIPDFKGDEESLLKIIKSQPDVIAHNIETVERLQNKVRDRRANYEQSLRVLANVKKYNKNIYTKSSIMLGIGETGEEVLQALIDLRKNNVDMLTLGQYLRPSQRHLAITNYVAPEKFKYFQEEALKQGFLYCASGPFIRSSYKAGELFIQGLKKDGEKSNA